MTVDLKSKIIVPKYPLKEKKKQKALFFLIYYYAISNGLEEQSLQLSHTPTNMSSQYERTKQNPRGVNLEVS